MAQAARQPRARSRPGPPSGPAPAPPPAAGPARRPQGRADACPQRARRRHARRPAGRLPSGSEKALTASRHGRRWRWTRAAAARCSTAPGPCGPSSFFDDEGVARFVAVAVDQVEGGRGEGDQTAAEAGRAGAVAPLGVRAFRFAVVLGERGFTRPRQPVGDPRAAFRLRDRARRARPGRRCAGGEPIRFGGASGNCWRAVVKAIRCPSRRDRQVEDVAVERDEGFSLTIADGFVGGIDDDLAGQLAHRLGAAPARRSCRRRRRWSLRSGCRSGRRCGRRR